MQTASADISQERLEYAQLPSGRYHWRGVGKGLRSEKADIRVPIRIKLQQAGPDCPLHHHWLYKGCKPLQHFGDVELDVWHLHKSQGVLPARPMLTFEVHVISTAFRVRCMQPVH